MGIRLTGPQYNCPIGTHAESTGTPTGWRCVPNGPTDTLDRVTGGIPIIGPVLAPSFGGTLGLAGTPQPSEDSGGGVALLLIVLVVLAIAWLAMRR